MIFTLTLVILGMLMTTVYSALLDPEDIFLQIAADNFFEWTHYNEMLLNATKTKEMLIQFETMVNADNIKPIIISGYEIEHVSSYWVL